jgi:hypothetical protein
MSTVSPLKPWRLLGLVALLFFTVSLSAAITSFGSLGSLDHGFEQAAILAALSVFVFLAALLAASLSRSFSAGLVSLLVSAAVGCFATAVLFLAAGMARVQMGPPYSFYSLVVLFQEAVFCYWPTSIVSVALPSYILLRRPESALVESLSVLPILFWGLDSTFHHSHRTMALSPDPAFFLLAFWQGVFVTGIALLAVTILFGWLIWKARATLPRVQTLFLGGITVLTVVSDWVISLFSTTIWLIGQRPAA